MSSRSHPQPKVLSVLARKFPVLLEAFLVRLDLPHTHRRPSAVASRGDMQLSLVTVHHAPIAVKALPHCLFLRNICNAGVCQPADLLINLHLRMVLWDVLHRPIAAAQELQMEVTF